METESEELKKNLKMSQVMHTGEPALCVFAWGVPASGGVYKMLAESLSSACRLSQRHIQRLRKGEGTEQKSSCCCGAETASFSTATPELMGWKSCREESERCRRAGPARGEGDLSPVP